MAVLFLVVGLEIRRERRQGDLADVRTAAVPVAGIGFTVPLPLAGLAVAHDPPLVDAAELGLCAGSSTPFAVGAVVPVWAGPDGPGGEPPTPPADAGPIVHW